MLLLHTYTCSGACTMHASSAFVDSYEHLEYMLSERMENNMDLSIQPYAFVYILKDIVVLNSAQLF